MTVWDGDYRNTETATANNAEDALKLVLVTPMGIGYGPGRVSSAFDTIAAQLALSGRSQWGWANYTLNIVETP